MAGTERAAANSCARLAASEHQAGEVPQAISSTTRRAKQHRQQAAQAVADEVVETLNLRGQRRSRSGSFPPAIG
jgi:CheY-like chemotaxis protein